MAEVVIRNNNVKVYVTQPSVLESVQVIQGPSGPQGLPGADGVDGANGADGVVQSIVPGSNITVDSTDPANPVVSASGGSAVATTFTPAGNISATNVQAAIQELDTEKSGTGHTHAASAVTVTPTGAIASTNVQSALAELDSEKSATTHTHSKVATGIRGYATSTQSVPSATWTAIALNGETYDSDGYHSTATNPSRITIPSGLGGKYLIAGAVSYAGNGAGTRHAGVRINGVTYTTRVVLNAAPAGLRSRVATLGVLSLAVGDYIELVAYQDSGASLEAGDTTTSGEAGESWIAIDYLGP